MHSKKNPSFSCPECPGCAHSRSSNVAERDLSDRRRSSQNRLSSVALNAPKPTSHSNNDSMNTQQRISNGDPKQRIHNITDSLRFAVNSQVDGEKSRPSELTGEEPSQQRNHVTHDPNPNDPSISVDFPEGRILIYNVSTSDREGTPGPLRDTGPPRRSTSSTYVGYSEENCTVLLRENYGLIKKVNSLRNSNDKLRGRVKELRKTNENLKAALSNAVNERNRLMSNMPSPRLYCNFTVTKMYEQWVRALRNELQVQKQQHLETVELLKRSSESERALTRQVARLEDSLVFFRQITREMASNQLGGGVDLPKNFDALYERGFAKGLAGGEGEEVEICAALLEENEALRQSLRRSESECLQKSRELEEMRQQLRAQTQEVENAAQDDFEQLKCVKQMLDEEREKLRMARSRDCQ